MLFVFFYLCLEPRRLPLLASVWVMGPSSSPMPAAVHLHPCHIAQASVSL